MSGETGLAEGIHAISRAEYDADPAPTPSLNQSLAKTLLDRSPAHARIAHPRLAPRGGAAEQETKFDLGQAVHALLLGEPDTIVAVDADDWRTKAAKERRAEALAAGLIPMLAPQVAVARAIAVAFREQIAAHEELAGVFNGAECERSILWRQGDVWLRGRPDLINRERRLIVDIKTTSGTANPSHWSHRQLYDIGADLQSAWYTAGLSAVVGGDWGFRFCVIETEPPHAMAVLALGPEAADLARRKMAVAVKLWGECLASGLWPAYPRYTCFVEAPAWQQLQWAEREARDAATPGASMPWPADQELREIVA